MLKKTAIILLAGAALCMLAVPGFADKGKPSFSPAIYADGETWGTKATTVLPAPNEQALQKEGRDYV
jgi:hypothetical protein